MSDTQKLLWYLKKIPILDVLPTGGFNDVIRRAELREIPRREVIFIPGDPGNSIFFLHGGRVKISRVTRDGRELTLSYRAAGELFGEHCLGVGEPREEMAEAMENALVTVLERDYFESLCKRYPRLGVAVMGVLNRRRQELEERLVGLVFRDVNAKLSGQLLSLGEEYGVEDPRGTLIAIKITHQEMANLIGSTRETVSLALAQFRKKGLITVDGRKVILTDTDGLRGLA